MLKKTLSDDELHTLLLEIVLIVNSKPLTDVPLETNESTPLTPNHLLRINHDFALPSFQTSEGDCYARQRFRLVQFATDEFWKRWIVEYPRTIFARSKWHNKKRDFQPGDVAFLIDYSVPREQWSLGKVLKSFSDKHGVFRSVLFKTSNGSLKTPTCKLCLIAPVDGKKLKFCLSFGVEIAMCIIMSRSDLGGGV